MRAGALLELPKRRLLRQRFPVGTILEHRQIRVGDRDDAGCQRDLPPDEPAGIPVAVPALVVRAHDVDDLWVDRGMDDERTLDRMAVDLPALVCGQWSGLLEDTVVDEELADVVQERAGDDGTAVDVRELQPAGEPVRAGRDEDCVPVRVFPARFGRDDAARGRDRKGGFAVRV